MYDKDSFLEAAKPLIKWLNENANPHAKVIVDTASAELLSGEIGIETFEFVKDYAVFERQNTLSKNFIS